jgi:hypothetical protein
MADVDCSTEMTGFHRTEVTLRVSDQADMRSRRDAGRVRLETGLSLKEHPQPTETVSQGSYAMRTMVQDDDYDYDIDDGAYFRSDALLDADGNALTPLAARQRVCEALKWDGRLKHEAEVKRNCVRQAYPEGYHIDVPVYRIVVKKNAAGEEVEDFELASGDAWTKQDARAVTRWYNDMIPQLNAGESDGSQMRRVTKLTKKMARSRKDWKSKTASGICITKLVADHFVSSDGRDDRALRETWKAVDRALQVSTSIQHPVLEGTNLADSGDAGVMFFRDCLDSSLNALEVLDSDGCTLAQARDAWDNVFDTTYFSDQPIPGPGSKEASVVVTSSDTARRNDGGGRFG